MLPDSVMGKIWLGILSVGGLWFAVRSVRQSDNPGRQLLRLGASAGLLLLGIFGAAYFLEIQQKASVLGRVASRIAAFAAPLLVAACGVLLGVLWAPAIGRLLAAPLTSLFDGGKAGTYRQPLYAIAEARRKRGRYAEAAAEVRKQLEEFPGDINGTLLLIDLCAKDLGQMEEAQAAMEEYLQNGPHPPKNLFRVLAHMAEIYLATAGDREKAQQCLERVQAMCPRTEQEMLAAQRLAHIGSAEFLEAKKQAVRVPVKEFDRRLGLQGKRPNFQRNEQTPEELANEYVRQLRAHPLDLEARENLARLYANHYRRLDMAVEQLETMVNYRNQQPRQVVRWLHLMADWHIQLGGDIEKAKECMRRISARFPNTAHDAQAQKRIHYLRRELRNRPRS